MDRTAFMTPEEILIRLRDRMLQHKMRIREAFLHFDTRKNGKISKLDFKKVLIGSKNVSPAQFGVFHHINCWIVGSGPAGHVTRR